MLLSNAPGARKLLWRTLKPGNNMYMRTFAAILVSAAVLYGIYYVYLKQMPTANAGTAPTQAKIGRAHV